MPAAGKTYRDRVTLAGRVIPLPPGDWRETLAVAVRNAQNGNIQAFAVFVRRSGQTLSGHLELGTSAIGHRVAGSTPIAGPCATDDTLLSDVRQASDSDAQDCTIIGFGSQAAYRQFNTLAWRSTNALNLITPPTLVSGEIRLVTPQAEIIVRYLLNPDLDGVPVDAEPNRALNGWSRNRFVQNPARKAFVDRLHGFLERYRLQLLPALQQSEPVPATVPLNAQPALKA